MLVRVRVGTENVRADVLSGVVGHWREVGNVVHWGVALGSRSSEESDGKSTLHVIRL